MFGNYVPFLFPQMETYFDIINLCQMPNVLWQVLVDTKAIDITSHQCFYGHYCFLLTDCKYFPNLVWYCPICNSKHSIYEGTIFTRTKTDFPQSLALIYSWANDFPAKYARVQCNVNKNTVTNFYYALSDAASSSVGTMPMIGGPGLTIEVDETLLSHRKYNKGRLLINEQIWVFGGICRETNDIFCIPVQDRTSNTLKQAIYQFIRPGSKIFSDSYKSYHFLDEDTNYIHRTVNHQENFINPVDGTHTQNIERLWRDLKAKKIHSYGIPSHAVDNYCMEFTWKRNNLKNLSPGQKFYRTLQLCGETIFS